MHQVYYIVDKFKTILLFESLEFSDSLADDLLEIVRSNSSTGSYPHFFDQICVGLG